MEQEEDALQELSDLVLETEDHQELRVVSTVLKIASPVLRDALKCGRKRGREDGDTAAGLQRLKVGGPGAWDLHPQLLLMSGFA